MIKFLIVQVSRSTQQIYGLLLDIKSSNLDVRWTWFQAPLQVEDALGKKFPVPSEYDFPTLQDIIRPFNGEGLVAMMVRSGDYELAYANHRTQILSRNALLRPGSYIIMAVIVVRSLGSQQSCPMLRCGSTETKVERGGGYRW
jgi:hypothetical protein